MKSVVLLVMSASLLLAASLSAQRLGQVPRVLGEPGPSQGSACAAEGARCLWGTAGGCSVYCQEPGVPVCEGAYCGFLGFPHPGRCFCSNRAG